MEALVIALLTGVAVAACGRSPLRAVAALACVVIVGVTVAALWSFSPAAIAAAWLLLVLAARRRRGLPLAEGVRPPAGVLAVAGIVAAVPLLILPVPLDTDAQGFGMLALAVRDGGTLDSLAPWRPAIAYLYSPGALVLFAAASALAGASMPAVMMGVSHAAAVLVVAVAWELGAELALEPQASPAVQPEPTAADRAWWSWATAVAATSSAGMWTALLDAHYTAVVGLLFLIAFVTAQMRYLRTGRASDMRAAIVLAAAVLMTHADTAVILALGLLAFAIVWWSRRGARPRRRLITATIVIPVGAALTIAPWVATLWPLIGAGIRSPYSVDPSHWRLIVFYHAVVWPLAAVLGALVWGRRRTWAIVMVVWIVLIIETSVLGWLERAVPAVTGLAFRFNYPFSLAWHGPIVPYLTLGAGTLVWIMAAARVRAVPVCRVRVTAAFAALAAMAVLMADVLLPFTRPLVPWFGTFSSANDLRAMRWIRDRTPAGVRILNYPGDYERQHDWEAHWAPVVTERDCVYFRMQPFFAGEDGVGAARHEQRTLLAFWRDPADPAHAERLLEAGISYVLVPESVGDPSSLDRAWRWKPPARLPGERSSPADAPFLTLVYRAGGAAVYRVSSPAPEPSAAAR